MERGGVVVAVVVAGALVVAASALEGTGLLLVAAGAKSMTSAPTASKAASVLASS